MTYSCQNVKCEIWDGSKGNGGNMHMFPFKSHLHARPKILVILEGIGKDSCGDVSGWPFYMAMSCTNFLQAS